MENSKFKTSSPEIGLCLERRDEIDSKGGVSDCINIPKECWLQSSDCCPRMGAELTAVTKNQVLLALRADSEIM